MTIFGSMPFDEVPNALLPLFQNPRLVCPGMKIGQRTVLQGVILQRTVFQGFHAFGQIEEHGQKLMLPTVEGAEHRCLTSFCCAALDSGFEAARSGALFNNLFPGNHMVSRKL
jgi:hypothetical protein